MCFVSSTYSSLSGHVRTIRIFYKAKYTDVAVLTGPARFTGALPVVLTVGARSVDARIRRALVNICRQTGHTSISRRNFATTQV